MVLGVWHGHRLVSSVLSLAQPCLGKTVGKPLPILICPVKKGLIVRLGALRFALKGRFLDHPCTTAPNCILAPLRILDSMALTT